MLRLINKYIATDKITDSVCWAPGVMVDVGVVVNVFLLLFLPPCVPAPICEEKA